MSLPATPVFDAIHTLMETKPDFAKIPDLQKIVDNESRYYLWKLLQVHTAVIESNYAQAVNLLNYITDKLKPNVEFKTNYESDCYNETIIAQKKYYEDTKARSQAYELAKRDPVAFENFQVERKRRLASCDGIPEKPKMITIRRNTCVPPFVSPISTTPERTDKLQTLMSISGIPNIPGYLSSRIENELTEATTYYENHVMNQEEKEDEEEMEEEEEEEVESKCQDVKKSRKKSKPVPKGVAFCETKANIISCVMGNINYIRSKIRKSVVFIEPKVHKDYNLDLQKTWTMLSDKLCNQFNNKIRISNKKIIIKCDKESIMENLQLFINAELKNYDFELD
uniref:PlxyGVORF24 protein n=1 Tax=Plutella xylostella granulovirus TaxID=98383 RepID=A0A1B2CSD7_9BBAC|nr:PlxyGVORF24 protein [Plutella xylostella granulovirus]